MILQAIVERWPFGLVLLGSGVGSIGGGSSGSGGVVEALVEEL